MPPISLPVTWMVILDFIAWAFFHMAISIICLKIPLAFFLEDRVWFRIFAWEKSGKRWQQLFRVKKWKGRVLDGATIFRKGYAKKRLHGSSISDLNVFGAETKRAELTHWLCIVPAPLFFLWNPIWVGWVMILYALLFNVPLIIVQRYNRGRIGVITSWTKG